MGSLLGMVRPGCWGRWLAARRDAAEPVPAEAAAAHVVAFEDRDIAGPSGIHDATVVEAQVVCGPVILVDGGCRRGSRR